MGLGRLYGASWTERVNRLRERHCPFKLAYLEALLRAADARASRLATVEDEMTVHVHALVGCAPTPLAHYLKALALLRLVAEQKDASARGFWKDDVFHLATALDWEQLARFFLDEYAPTLLVAPWNGGSGFYPKDNKSGFEPMSVPMPRGSRNTGERSRWPRSSSGTANERPAGDEKVEMIGVPGRGGVDRCWTGWVPRSS